MIRDDMLVGEPAEPARLDFEQGMSLFPRLTLGLIVLLAGVFAWQLSSGALKDEKAIVAAGALVRQRVAAGEAWRVLTAVLLHGGLEHLIGNCLGLYVMGLACERAFGIARTAVIFLLAGVCGSLLSLAFNTGPSVGASGAVFGVAGAVIVFFYRFRHTVLLRDKRIGFVLLVWAIYKITEGFLEPMVDNWAHLGGLLGGALAACVLRPPLLPVARRQSGERFGADLLAGLGRPDQP